MFFIEGKYTKATVYASIVEQECVKQIAAATSHPAFTNPIAIMPDTHAGSGCVVGFTTRVDIEKIVPNIIGVDIGCGMLSAIVPASKLPNLLNERCTIDFNIRAAVPMSMEYRSQSKASIMDMDFSKINSLIKTLGFKVDVDPAYIEKSTIKKIVDAFPKSNVGRLYNSIGSLGGGNHFIEIGYIESSDSYAVTVHTGSRNLGKLLCELHVSKTTTQGLVNNSQRDMGYLQGSLAHDYLIDMVIAQEYASLNRQEIMRKILEVLGVEVAKNNFIESVHNMIDFSDMILRKGAIRSYKGETLIIPFNMEDGILFCEGKSTPEWNFSAPHGAGRVLSRSAVKKQHTTERTEKSMKSKNIFTSCIPGDEIPEAYKPATIIESEIEPTATILFKAVPVLNIKGA